MKRFFVLLLLPCALAHAQRFGELTPEGVPMEVVKAEQAIGTVILAHGCGGPLYDRDEGWSRRLVAAGFNTVRFHSWKYRKMPEGVCLTDAVTGDMRADEEVRYVANWIRAQPWHPAGRLAILGWSHGGTTALAASTKKDLGIDRAVAMYPWCHAYYSKAVIPVQIHMGSQDDWTPARLCRSLYKGLFWRNELGSYIEYEGATHAFDRFMDISTSVQGRGEYGAVSVRHMRTDAGARERAIETAIRFLSAP